MPTGDDLHRNKKNPKWWWFDLFVDVVCFICTPSSLMAEEAVSPVGMMVMRVCGYRELGSNRWRRRTMALCLIYLRDIYVLEQ